VAIADLDLSATQQGGHSSLLDANPVFAQWWHDGLKLLSPMPLQIE